MSSDKDEQKDIFQVEGDMDAPVEEASGPGPDEIEEIRSDIEKIKEAINEIVKKISGKRRKEGNGAVEAQRNGEVDLKEAAKQIKGLLEGNLQNKVQGLEGLASDLRATQKAIEEEAHKIGDLRQVTEEAIEERIRNIDNEIEGFFGGQAEKLEEIGETLEKPISVAAKKVEDDLNEFIEHFKDKLDSIDENTEERIKLIGQAAAQIQRVVGDFETKGDNLDDKIEYLTKAKGEIGEYTDQARTTAQILKGAALQDDIQRLEELSEKSVQRIIHVAGETQTRMIEQIQAEMNNLLNKIDEKRMRFDSNMELIDKRMGQKLQEMRTIKEAVEDLEKKHKSREKTLIREAKTITRREIAVIVMSVFTSVITAILLLYFAGVV